MLKLFILIQFVIVTISASAICRPHGVRNHYFSLLYERNWYSFNTNNQSQYTNIGLNAVGFDWLLNFHEQFYLGTGFVYKPIGFTYESSQPIQYNQFTIPFQVGYALPINAKEIEVDGIFYAGLGYYYSPFSKTVLNSSKNNSGFFIKLGGIYKFLHLGVQATLSNREYILPEINQSKGSFMSFGIYAGLSLNKYTFNGRAGQKTIRNMDRAKKRRQRRYN